MGGEHGVDQLVLGLEVLAEGGNVAEKMAKKDCILKNTRK